MGNATMKKLVYMRLVRSWPVLVALAGVPISAPLRAQVQRNPMAFSEVNHLLRSYVGPRQVAVIAERFRISFEVTPDVAERLTRVGADEELLETLRSVSPSSLAATPPPTVPGTVIPASITYTPSAITSLVLNSGTGGVEVYLDDVRQGKASSEGVLKIPDAAPGQRKLRLSREGYRDFEGTVELKPGQITNQVVPALGTERANAGDTVSTPSQILLASAPLPATNAVARSAPKPLAAEPVFVKDAFHIVGIPAIRRNKKIDLSITTHEMDFMEGGKRVYQIPFERIERVQMNLEKRDYAKTTYAAVLAVGAPGALVLAYKRTVDALVINYKNERNGTMELVIQVSKGMGTPCLERLAAGGIAVGPPAEGE
jgi:hypothetical protein